MENANKIRFCISSPPDREFLVAEIFVGNEQIAEINQENEILEIEIYPRKSKEWWKLHYAELIRKLEQAKQELIKRSG